MNKYERCVLGVKSKQTKSCEKKKWKGKGCVNPFAICTKSVGRPRRVGRPRKSKKSIRKSKKSTRKSKKSTRKSKKSTRK